MSAASSSSSANNKPKKTPRIPETALIDEREKQVLELITSKLGASIEKHNVSQGTLLRFVRGFKDDPNPTDKAVEMVADMLKWRETSNVEKIVATVHPKANLFKSLWQSGLHGESRDGHPVYIERLGAISPSKVQKEFSHDDLLLFHIQMMERITAYKDALSATRGKPIYKQVVILDLKGLGMSHLSDKFISPMKKILHIDQFYYPETLYIMFIVNAGLLVKTGWKIANPFLDPITKSCIHFGNDKLLEWIDKGQLPKFLGGDCRCGDDKCLMGPFVGGPSDGKGKYCPEPSVHSASMDTSKAIHDSDLIIDNSNNMLSPMPDSSPNHEPSPSPAPLPDTTL